jgi:hypothetical protein
MRLVLVLFTGFMAGVGAILTVAMSDGVPPDRVAAWTTLESPICARGCVVVPTADAKKCVR